MISLAAVCRGLFVPELRMGGVPAKPLFRTRLFAPQWNYRGWVNRRVHQIGHDNSERPLVENKTRVRMEILKQGRRCQKPILQVISA